MRKMKQDAIIYGNHLHAVKSMVAIVSLNDCLLFWDI